MIRAVVAAAFVALSTSAAIVPASAGTAPVMAQAFGGLSSSCVLGCKAAIDERLTACGSDAACKAALVPEFSSCVQKCDDERGSAAPPAEGGEPLDGGVVLPFADEDGFWYAPEEVVPVPPSVDATNVDAVCVRACSDKYATCVPSCAGESHCLNSCAKTYDLCVRKCINLPSFAPADDGDEDSFFPGLGIDGDADADGAGMPDGLDGADDDTNDMFDDLDGMGGDAYDLDGMGGDAYDLDGMGGETDGFDRGLDGADPGPEERLAEEEEEVVEDIFLIAQPCFESCEGSLQACLVGAGAAESGDIPAACESGMRACMSACLASPQGDLAAAQPDLQSNAV